MALLLLFLLVQAVAVVVVFLLCKSIAKNKMRYFLAPSGQPKMMRKNFMHSDCCQLSWCAILRMKFYSRRKRRKRKHLEAAPEDAFLAG